MVDTRIHTALFHLHKVQEEAKLTNSSKCKESAFLWYGW